MDKREIQAALNKKLDANWDVYVRRCLAYSPGLLFNRANEIAAHERVNRELRNGDYPADMLEYLLRFENPLHVMGDHWLAENSVSVTDEFHHTLWNLMDKGDAEQDYDLDPTYAPKRTAVEPRSMDVNRFWGIIETAKKHMDSQGSIADSLTHELEKCDTEDIVLFGRIFDEYHDMARKWLVWSAGNLFTGGLTDDGFIDFRSWLIGRGQETYTEILLNPDSLANYDAFGVEQQPTEAVCDEQKRSRPQSADGTPVALDEFTLYAASYAYRIHSLDYDEAYRQTELSKDCLKQIHGGIQFHPHINRRIENEQEAIELLPHCHAAFGQGHFNYNSWLRPVEQCYLDYELPEENGGNIQDRPEPQQEQEM